MRFSLRTLLMLTTAASAFLGGYQYCIYRIERPFEYGRYKDGFHAKVENPYGRFPSVHDVPNFE